MESLLSRGFCGALGLEGDRGGVEGREGRIEEGRERRKEEGREGRKVE